VLREPVPMVAQSLNVAREVETVAE